MTIDYHQPSIILLLLLLVLFTRPAQADLGPPGPKSYPYGQNFNPSTGVVIIVLVVAFFFMGFFSIYIRYCSDNSAGSGSRTRGILAGSLRSRQAPPRGLDPDVIDTFPTFDYAAVKSLKIGKGALECAVCLTEFEDHDTLRLIPKCDHVFHPDCIDAWLVGHTTCPVCRASLVPDPESGESLHAPQNDAVLGLGEDRENENNSMEEPLQGRMSRNRTMRSMSFGRPRWLGKFSKSNSTGHVAVKQWENMERFRLRLPDEVRKQIMSGKLERTTSLVVLPRVTSSRRGYRTGFGEGSSSTSKGRFDRSGRSDRWVFSFAPPFFSRVPSSHGLPKVAAATTTTSREGSLRGSIRAELTQLPV